MYHLGRELEAHSLGLGSKSTAYDAEMAGVLMGLRRAVKVAQDEPVLTKIHLFTDSADTTKALKDDKLKPGQLMIHNIVKTASTFLDNNPGHQLTISWIPGHCDMNGNTRADELAKAGASLANIIGPAQTTKHALRSASEKALKQWTSAWERENPGGQWAAADRIAPALNPPPHFRQLKDKRELYGCLVQC